MASSGIGGAGAAALAALFAMRRSHQQQRRARCVVDEFQKRRDNSQTRRFNKTPRAEVPIKEAGPRVFCRGLKTPPAAGVPAPTSARRGGERPARRGASRGTTTKRRRAAARRARDASAPARTRLAALHRRSMVGRPALLRLQESSAAAAESRFEKGEHYEALGRRVGAALRRWRLIVASRKSTRERYAPLVDAVLRRACAAASQTLS